jgi:hypothetical protein
MFSVLIPCYKPTLPWLRLALWSVTSQLDMSKNQLLILDDCSPDILEMPELAYGKDQLPEVQLKQKRDFLELMVEEAGGTFLEHGCERGGVATHNHLISMAWEPYVHILHPDDFVLQGFYTGIEQAAKESPDCALYATDWVDVNEEGIPYSASNAIEWLMSDGSFASLHTHQLPLPCSTVIRREAYEKWGYWNPLLVHTGDWECAARMVTKGGGYHIRWPLACYRVSPQNHTNRLVRTAQNLRDYLRLAIIASAYMPVDHAKFREMVVARAKDQIKLAQTFKDTKAELANRAFLTELETPL